MVFFRRNALHWLKLSLAISMLLSITYCMVVWKLHSVADHYQKRWLRQLDGAGDITSQKLSKDEFSAPTLQKQLQVHPGPVHSALTTKADTRDYHNYTLMVWEAAQTGPGEQGEPYHLPANLDKQKEKFYRVNGFNALASDDIALNRSLKDIRHIKCRDIAYLSTLPTVSVVVPFHDEHLSTLLRTAVSVLNRAPQHLLLEVLLVDDASTKEFLGPSLDKYLVEHLPKARVLRLKQRSGLITARLAGAREAKGDVIVFLDSHTECTTNWLPPLLEPIQRDYRTVVCPFIDVIDYETFEYRAQDDGARGAFDWELYYKRLPLSEQDKTNMPQPFKSPVMAGGLFAISRRFFWELGGYDPGLQIWGGEQYELSFKVWQCGGSMVDVPCSRVGHVYRKYAPFPNPGMGDYLGRNYKRVAEVWMDEYAEFVYKRRPHYRTLPAGDLTEQRALRQRLNCRPFSWFMKEVAYDLMGVYPPVEPPDYGSGKVSSVASAGLCVDTGYRQHGEAVTLRQCGAGEQEMHLTWHKDIRPGRRNVCLDVSSGDARAPVLLYTCHGMGGNQLWQYKQSSQQLQHGDGSSPRCLDHDHVTHQLFVASCTQLSDTQRWKLEHLDQERLKSWGKHPDKGDGAWQR